MNTKEIRDYKADLKLSEKQKSILFGTLLGDGHLETRDNGKTYRLKIEHSIKQRDYTDWLHNQLKKWIRGEVYKKSKNDREYVGFTTYSHEEFKPYAKLFYDDFGKKRIPETFKELIDPLSLAIWFMDDGSLKSLRHRTYIIHSLGFQRKDLEIVKDSLLKKFNIELSLHKQKEKYLRIYILSKSAKTFEDLIRKYVSAFPSMKHKMVNINAQKVTEEPIKVS